MFTLKIHKLIIRCKDENTEEDGEQGIHRRIEQLEDIRNNTEWLLFDRQVGGGGHRGDVGDDGERPRQRRRGAEGPSGPGDWLCHAGLVSRVMAKAICFCFYHDSVALNAGMHDDT